MKLDQETPADLTLHLILAHYATRKHPKVRSWIKGCNPRQKKRRGIERIVINFTPMFPSGNNLVECFFRDLSVDCVRDGSFQSVAELVEAYLAERDLNPVRYEWRAKEAEILGEDQAGSKGCGGGKIMNSDSPNGTLGWGSDDERFHRGDRSR